MYINLLKKVFKSSMLNFVKKQMIQHYLMNLQESRALVENHV